MLGEFSYKIKATHKTPCTVHLLKIQEDANKLDKERRSIFHTYLRKVMFLCKIAQTNLDQSISFLYSRLTDAKKVN